MNKRRIAAIVALGLVLVLSQSYFYFFPAVEHNCKYDIGMAWAPGNLVVKSQTDFCAQWYFHSASYNVANLPKGAVPIIRPANAGRAITALKTYRGPCILLNEPDRPDQDNLAPKDAADFYFEMTKTLPNCKFVTPNSIDPKYFQAFFEAVKPYWRSQDKPGTHMYQAGSGCPAPVFYPNERITILTDVLSETGLDQTIWITEVGVPNCWSAPTIQDYYLQMFTNPNVDVTFIYTPHCGGYTPHACARNLYVDETGNRFTTTGTVLRQVMGYQTAYP